MQKSLDELKALLVEPKVIKYDDVSDNFYIENPDGGRVIIQNEFEVVKTFDQTDVKIADRLLDINQVFMEESVSDVTREQETFF